MVTLGLPIPTYRRVNTWEQGERARAYLNKGTAGLDDVESSLDRNLCSTGIDDEINATGTTICDAELLLQVFRVPETVIGAALASLWCEGQICVGGGIALGELEASGDDVDSNNALCAQSLGNSHAEEADGSTSKDSDRLIGLEASEGGDGVNANGKGLHLRKSVSGILCRLAEILPLRRLRATRCREGDMRDRPGDGRTWSEYHRKAALQQTSCPRRAKGQHEQAC